jgi:hypothetical protein
MTELTDEEISKWAANRADDAGRLAREVIRLREHTARLETALGDLIDRLDEIADAIKPVRATGRSTPSPTRRESRRSEE